MQSGNRLVLLGIPYWDRYNKKDNSPSYKIRTAMEEIEDFSVYQERMLPKFVDLGDITPCSKDSESVIEEIHSRLKGLLKPSDRVLTIGGNHTISYPLIRIFSKYTPGIDVIHIDAHLDRRDRYLNERLNYATVMRRVSELEGVSSLVSFGYRSWSPEESAEDAYPFEVYRHLEDYISKVPEGAKFYLSIDLDILDPSEFPAVSNPEPGGISFRELLESILLLKGKLVSADIVEYRPSLDPGFSAFTGAVLTRELLILLR